VQERIGKKPISLAGFLFGRPPRVRSLNVLASLRAFRYLSSRQRGSMVQRVSTVAFEGIEARSVDVQVQVAPGLPAFAN
jgi:hypothetical protein